MKKKLMAALAAGLVAAPVFASGGGGGLTLYGVIDLGIDNFDDGSQSVVRITSGGLSSSRLGFKGEEDLGNGLTAGFQLELGFLSDTGLGSAHGDNTLGASSAPGAQVIGSVNSLDTGIDFFARTARLYLQGDFGTVALGRQYIAGSEVQVAVDVGARGLPLSTANLWKNVHLRADNAITYRSPVVDGFYATAMYSAGAESTEDQAFTEANGFDDAGKSYTLGLNYKSGPVYVGVAYEDVSAPMSTAALAAAGVQKPDDKDSLLVGGTYDFGAAKVFVSYASGETKRGGTKTLDHATAAVGVSAAISPEGTVLVNYARADNKLTDNADATLAGVAYLHSVTPRTTLYMSYARIDNDALASYKLNSASSISPTITAGNDPSTVQVGIRHKF